MLTYDQATPTDERQLHLPAVTDDDCDAFMDRLLEMADDLPEINVTVSAHSVGPRWKEIAPSMPTAVVVPLVETIFDPVVVDRLSKPEFHAQFAHLAMLPTVTEAIAVQIGFGWRAGEEIARKLARIVAQAQQRGITADAFVQELAAAGAVPKDRTYRFFRGESRRGPSADRIRRGIAFLRTTAALTPEPLRAPMLCIIGWLHWAQGKRAHAIAYLAEARRIEPSNLLANGLTELFVSVAPRWFDQ